METLFIKTIGVGKSCVMKSIPFIDLMSVIIMSSCNNSLNGVIDSRPDKPNIIYILADDMSYFDISALGQRHFDTPNLDKLLNEGMFFHEAYAGSPESGPSRASIMTGMHMGHCRIRRNDSFRGQEFLQNEDVTIAEMLKKAGYVTGMFGKWGIGTPGTPGTPDKQGFDYSIGFYDQGRAHTYFPNYLMENGEVLPLPQNYGYDMANSYRHSRVPAGLRTYDKSGKLIPKGVKDPDKAVFSQNLIQEKALEFIRENKSNSFFLYYPTQLPHGPVIAPDISKFKNRPWLVKYKEWAAMIELLDTHVGQIINLLEKLGLRENTLILFSSDNGYSNWGYMGRKAYEDDPIFNNKGPWDRGKFIASDGGSRVPLFANWPKVIKPGSKSNEIVALFDIFATVCDIIDIEPPQIDGKSFLPILKNEFPKEKRLHDYLYRENGSFNENMQSVRLRNWFAYRDSCTVPIKVFDLSKDITCSVDVAEAHPEIVKEVLAIFKKEHIPSEWYPNPEDSKEERLMKREKAKACYCKEIRPNTIRPRSMKELQQMFDEQKGPRN